MTLVNDQRYGELGNTSSVAHQIQGRSAKTTPLIRPPDPAFFSLALTPPPDPPLPHPADQGTFRRATWRGTQVAVKQLDDDLIIDEDKVWEKSIDALVRAPPRNFHAIRQEWAAVRIQSAFHAFLTLEILISLLSIFLFEERHRYAEYEDIDRCREVLEAIACKRYCEELGRARRNRIKKYGWDIVAWKANEPHWCVAPIHWRGLCDIFFSDAWQEGKKPTMEDLYIHIHYARENGVSPVVAQKSTAEEGVTEINEDSDVNRGADPTADETSEQVHEFDINTLQFSNKRKEKVYRKVKELKADQANAELDDSTLFLTALGPPTHGRAWAFGSVLEGKVQTPTTRERQNHVASSLSGVTNSVVQETFFRAEVDAIVQERDRRIAEE
ncbi:protein IQ-DOMAIN 1-like protein [Carex littledalei]|uniref:Protein IQ-DOMAIN 1-like protein n=1 Tax=Carex littledalei TaxID=544730 RepID=A0A833QYM8_9POAL|nr:protein IQ-DOMAIN 1-like protein [Carex littledalei]